MPTRCLLESVAGVDGRGTRTRGGTSIPSLTLFCNSLIYGEQTNALGVLIADGYDAYSIRLGGGG